MYSPAGTSTLTVEWFDCHLTADCFDNVRDIYYQILLSQLLIKPFICIIASIFSLTFGCSNGSPPAAPRPLPACINCSGHREARLTFSRWRHRTIFFFSILLPSRAWALRPAGDFDGWGRAFSFYPSTRIHPMRSDLSWWTAPSSKYGKCYRLYVWTLLQVRICLDIYDVKGK